MCWLCNFCIIENEFLLMEHTMKELTDLADILSGLPPGSLAVVLILAGFGLAGYAIYAVLTVTKQGK